MRKFAVVPAIVAGILILYASSASAGGTSNTIGNYTFHNFGGVSGTSTRIGNYTFHNFGSVSGTSTRIGNYTFHSGSLFGD